MSDANEPRLRIAAIAVGLLVIGGLSALLIYGPGLIPLPGLPSLPETAPAPETIELPEEYRKRLPRYGQVKQLPELPLPAPPAPVAPPPTPTIDPTGLASLLPSLPSSGLPPLTVTPPKESMSPLLPPQGAPGTGAAAPEGKMVSTVVPRAEVPVHKKWDFGVKGTSEPGASVVPREEVRPDSKAQGLIQPATWALPAYPLLTIYRSQTLIGRLAQAVNSDIPGQVKIELIMPLFDKFGKDQMILDKGTLIIASQEGKAQYGNTRLGLKLEQLELLTGEVVTLKAMVGDQEGANGIAGKVNNHYGKLLLATGLSAILNIGVRTAAGTPGQNQYYQNPAQQVAQDVGQDVQRSASSVIERELKIPPTIEIKAGTNVTINLQENVQFNRRPVVVR